MGQKLENMPKDIRDAVLAQMGKENLAKASTGAPPYIQKPGPRPKGRKYGNERVHCDILDRAFDSKWERTVAMRLFARQRAGEISELNFQVKVCLLGCVYLRPDFQYKEDGELITHEAKGMETQKYVLQRKLWAVCGPTEYRISYQSKVDVIIRPCPTDEMIKFVLRHLNRAEPTR